MDDTVLFLQHLKRLTFRGLLFRPRQLWHSLIITFICTTTDHQVGGCRQVGGWWDGIVVQQQSVGPCVSQEPLNRE